MQTHMQKDMYDRRFRHRVNVHAGVEVDVDIDAVGADVDRLVWVDGISERRHVGAYPPTRRLVPHCPRPPRATAVFALVTARRHRPAPPRPRARTCFGSPPALGAPSWRRSDRTHPPTMLLQHFSPAWRLPKLWSGLSRQRGVSMALSAPCQLVRRP